MAVKVTNNATSTLAANIDTDDTTLSIQTGDASKFPTLGVGDWCPLTIIDSGGNMEIMKVTGRSSAVLTVVRGQEGTTAKNFTAGAHISVRLTAATLEPALREATTLLAGLQSAADKAKLDGIDDGATANSSDADLLDRTNHTGTQAIDTVAGLQAALDGKATSAQGAKADSAVQPGDLADVATSGSYDDLSNKPANTHASKRIYTSSSSWSKPAGLVKVVVTVIAGGGGGGGKMGFTTNGSGKGGNGGGGGASIKTILAASLASTVTVTVGAGGAGGTGGDTVATNGGTGGTSSFGSHCSATGGGGGALANNSTGAPGNGGSGSSGDVNLLGDRGLDGGGSSALFNGRAAEVSNAHGNDGRANSGGGGSGGQYSNNASGSGRNGGDGGSGLVIVEEFFQ